MLFAIFAACVVGVFIGWFGVLLTMDEGGPVQVVSFLVLMVSAMGAACLLVYGLVRGLT